MQKKRRIWKRIAALIVLVLVAVGVVVYSTSFSSAWLNRKVEERIAGALECQVELKEARLWLGKGRLSVEGLSLREKEHDEVMLEVGRVEVFFSPFELLSGRKELPRVEVHDPSELKVSMVEGRLRVPSLFRHLEERGRRKAGEAFPLERLEVRGIGVRLILPGEQVIRVSQGALDVWREEGIQVLWRGKVSSGGEGWTNLWISYVPASGEAKLSGEIDAFLVENLQGFGWQHQRVEIAAQASRRGREGFELQLVGEGTAVARQGAWEESGNIELSASGKVIEEAIVIEKLHVESEPLALEGAGRLTSRKGGPGNLTVDIRRIAPHVVQKLMPKQLPEAIQIGLGELRWKNLGFEVQKDGEWTLKKVRWGVEGLKLRLRQGELLEVEVTEGMFDSDKGWLVRGIEVQGADFSMRVDAQSLTMRDRYLPDKLMVTGELEGSVEKMLAELKGWDELLPEVMRDLEMVGKIRGEFSMALELGDVTSFLTEEQNKCSVSLELSQIAHPELDENIEGVVCLFEFEPSTLRLVNLEAESGGSRLRVEGEVTGDLTQLREAKKQLNFWVQSSPQTLMRKLGKDFPEALRIAPESVVEIKLELTEGAGERELRGDVFLRDWATTYSLKGREVGLEEVEGKIGFQTSPHLTLNPEITGVIEGIHFSLRGLLAPGQLELELVLEARLEEVEERFAEFLRGVDFYGETTVKARLAYECAVGKLGAARSRQEIEHQLRIIEACVKDMLRELGEKKFESELLDLRVECNGAALHVEHAPVDIGNIVGELKLKEGRFIFEDLRADGSPRSRDGRFSGELIPFPELQITFEGWLPEAVLEDWVEWKDTDRRVQREMRSTATLPVAIASKLRVEQFRYADFLMEDLQTDFWLQHRQRGEADFGFENIEAKAYEGEIEGEVELGVRRGRQVSYRVDVAGQGLHAEAVLEASGQQDPFMSGRLRARVGLNGVTQRAQLKAMAGMAEFEITEARFLKDPIFIALARVTALVMLEDITFNTVTGTLMLDRQGVRMQGTDFNNPLLSLSVEGEIDYDQQLELWVLLAVSQSGLLNGIPLLNGVYEGLRNLSRQLGGMVLKFRVEGRPEEPQVTVVPLSADEMKRLWELFKGF